MKIQKSAEDYLETVLILSRQNGSVRAVDIANALNFSKPSVSIAMKNLRENGYVELDGNGCIRLCDKGREIAERIYERHTVLTDWLTGWASIRSSLPRTLAASSMSSARKVLRRFAVRGTAVGNG